MASIDWTAPGDLIKGNTKAFRKLTGTGRKTVSKGFTEIMVQFHKSLRFLQSSQLHEKQLEIKSLTFV